jgi:MFS superfamily sulfate permease-like transporter
VFKNIESLYTHTSAGSIVIASLTLLFLIVWKRTLAKKITFLPASFVTVLFGVLLAIVIKNYFPSLHLSSSQFVNVPENIFSQIKFPDYSVLFTNVAIWKTAVIIAFVASLETLLSTEAIDKLDPYNRITSQNRELVAQGTGNFVSGLLGGLPITAVIVRSSANAEAGAKTGLSSFMHGAWLLLAVMFAIPLLNQIPYCVLAVILVRTGYNLAKPKMIASVYKQRREQFLPFIVTVIAVLFTDLLIGVLIGIAYALYFLMKHTYRAGFTIKERKEGEALHFTIELALNVSFINKKRFMEMLDSIPPNSIVEINGSDSVYIDYDILEIFHDFKSKAHQKNIKLIMKDIPDVETIELH